MYGDVCLGNDYVVGINFCGGVVYKFEYFV